MRRLRLDSPAFPHLGQFPYPSQSLLRSHSASQEDALGEGMTLCPRGGRAPLIFGLLMNNPWALRYIFTRWEKNN